MLTQLKIWGVGSNENLKSKLDKRAVKLWALPPVPFSYHPVLFLNTRAFFFPITHFRGCMKCSENSSKKIAKRKKGGYLIKQIKLALVRMLPICASFSTKNSDVFILQEMFSIITVTNLNFHQKKNVPSFERKDLSYCLDPKPLMWNRKHIIVFTHQFHNHDDNHEKKW